MADSPYPGAAPRCDAVARGRSPYGAFRPLGRPEEDIFAWIRRAYADLGDAGFTREGYKRWRRGQLLTSGEPIPSYDLLRARYGSFSEAAHAAIPTLPHRGLRLPGPARIRANLRAATPDLELGKRVARPAGGEGRADVPWEAPPVAPGEAVTAPGSNSAQARLRVVYTMLDQLSFENLRELERALRRRIEPAARPAAQRRTSRLAFLAQLLLDAPLGADGRPTIERVVYEDLRPPDAPSAERLQRAYGSWAAVCRAAAGVLEDGRKRSVGTHGAWRALPPTPYTVDDVCAAARRCGEEIGRLPSSHDYHYWGIEKRARARAAGRRDPIPLYPVVCRLFRTQAERAGSPIWKVVLRDAFRDASSG